MKFSKKKFLKSAPSGIKEQLSEILDVLDGQEVVFDGRYGSDGYVAQYTKDGQEYYLHPIYRSWCN